MPVGYILNGPDWVPTPTTLTSPDGHANVTFNQPLAGSASFNSMEITVTSTDGSPPAAFSQFFCASNGDFIIDTSCPLTLTLPPPAAPTATVAASPTATIVGGVSTVTFTLTNPNSAVGLAGGGGRVHLPRD